MNIIIGNIVALIACIIMLYSGYLKQKNKIIFAQSIELILAIISNLFLGAITGAITNTIGLIRNALVYKNKLNKIEKIILIILVTVTSLLFNNLGFIGLLPLISTVVYIIFINTKNIIHFKLLIIFTMVLWFIYDFTVMSYVAAFFDFLTLSMNIIVINQIKKKRKNSTK